MEPLRRFFAGLLFAVTALAASAQEAPFRVLIGVDPSDDAIRRDQEQAISLTPILSASLKKKVAVSSTIFLTDVMRATRTLENDVIIGPPTVIASAISHGYRLLAINDRSASFSLVAGPAVAKLQDLQGKRLYLTQQDSTRAYLAKGLLREANINLKSLGALTYGTTSGAGLIALQFKLADATFADDTEIARWMAEHPGEGHILSTSRKIPAGMAIAVLKTMPVADSAALLKWITSPAARDVGLGRLREVNAADLEGYGYIAGLGILTPAALPGATVVGAKMAAELMQQGALAVDTRTEKEYKHEHVAAAIFAPYVEKSLKEAEFDPALDDYRAIRALPQDKPLIFMCNGPECWKSYKASKVALTLGFKKVYWFRGGVPEWREQARPLAHAASS